MGTGGGSWGVSLGGCGRRRRTKCEGSADSLAPAAGVAAELTAGRTVGWVRERRALPTPPDWVCVRVVAVIERQAEAPVLKADDGLAKASQARSARRKVCGPTARGSWRRNGLWLLRDDEEGDGRS